MHRKSTTNFLFFMSIQSRISAICDLGQFFLFNFENETSHSENLSKYKFLQEEFLNQLKLAEIKNPWFNQENIAFCLTQWGKLLTNENLEKWANSYSYTNSPKNVGIIMAGNIPLVGFHDLISVLISGHNAVVKTSSKDEVLIRWVLSYLKNYDNDFNQSIQLVEKLQNVDAVIATGSNNTARYFEYYFRDIPHIIRKNRTSISVLDGTETSEELKNLAIDIFRYFGLGCRNVTKLYLPKNYNTDLVFEAFFDWSNIINHPKYANNYDYNRAIYLMAKESFLDNNFVILKPSSDLHSPIGVINYEFYTNLDEVKLILNEKEEEIQCIVGNNFPIKFGKTQTPSLTDYADNIDTMKFLNSL